MNKILFLLLFLTLNVSISFSQTKSSEPKLIDEFGELGREFLMSHADTAAHQLEKESSGTKMYYVFYEGKHSQEFFDKKTNKMSSKLVNPKREQGLNTVKSHVLHLTKWRKLPKEKIVIVNGGFREHFMVQVWLVPENAEPPKSSPILTEKDVKFSNGRSKVFDCQEFYNSSM